MSLKAFSASEDEMEVANQILLSSDCQDGILQSDAAIDVFKRSGLSYTILRDIWNMADENKSGDLTIHELAAAIRLMGWVQAGESLEESLLAKSGPLPTLDGVTDVVGKRNVSPQTSRFPPVNHDDMRHFKRSFDTAGPLGGFLDGDIVLEIYMTSNRSYGELWKIRKLVDVTERGALDFREFAMGMYLIQALQSRFIASVPSTVPPELHELFSDPALFDLHTKSQWPSHPHRSKTPSLHSSSPSRPHILPSVIGSNIPQVPILIPPADDYWDVLPIERAEADKHFQKLDLDRRGYIGKKTAATFMLNYRLSSADRARIWSLVDLNSDNRLTQDGFAVAMYLINHKIAGDEIPESLPPSLVTPSMRSKGSSSPTPTPISPGLVAKFKSPPPPPPKRDSHGKRSTTLDHSSRLNHSTPPPLPQKFSPLQASFSTSQLSPANPPEVTSPFDDPTNGTSTPKYHSSLRTSKPLPPDHSNNEALEEFKKETSRLALQVDSLLSQLKSQNNLRDVNESLRKENDLLRTQMRDMERTVSEVLSANDQNGSQEQYIQEIDRLSTELANREAQHERVLAVLTDEDKDLRRQLRESQAATTRAKNEVDGLQQSIASHQEEITELRARLSDMGQAMAEEPGSSSDNRELRVLFRDVTRENDTLKTRVREMQQSMEQLLLSTKFHAKFDVVERENRRLQAHVQELEMLATQLQSNNSAQQQQVSDGLARENEQLKVQLQTGHRAFAEFQSTSQTTIEELQRRLAMAEGENNRLKMDGQRQEDNVPPPAYDDSTFA